jgi:mRNA-degrading endonuclease toxin of MazEF toxin-antitoxin module
MVGIEQGLKHTSAVNLDHVQTVDRSRLKKYLGHLGKKTMGEICRALSIATGCED